MLIGALMATLVGFGFGAYGVVVARGQRTKGILVLAVVTVLNGVLFEMILPSAIPLQRNHPLNN